MPNINPDTGLSASQTIFPRVNFYKTRTGRLGQRGLNGRIFNDSFHTINNPEIYPPEAGSLSFSDALPFPVDLGDLGAISTIYDLRQDDGIPTTYDLALRLLLLNQLDLREVQRLTRSRAINGPDKLDRSRGLKTAVSIRHRALLKNLECLFNKPLIFD